MPKPKKKESLVDFTKRFMSDKDMVKKYPNVKQRYAIMLSEYKRKK